MRWNKGVTKGNGGRGWEGEKGMNIRRPYSIVHIRLRIMNQCDTFFKKKFGQSFKWISSQV